MWEKNVKNLKFIIFTKNGVAKTPYISQCKKQKASPFLTCLSWKFYQPTNFAHDPFSKQNTNDDSYVISYWLKHNRFISKHLQWFYKVLLDTNLTKCGSNYWEKLFNWLISYLNYLMVSLLNRMTNVYKDFRFYNEFKVENGLNIVTLNEWLWNKDFQDNTLLNSIEKTLELKIQKLVN